MALEGDTQAPDDGGRTVRRLRQMLTEQPVTPRQELAKQLGISRKTLYKHLARIEAGVEVLPSGTPPESLTPASTPAYEDLWEASLSAREQAAMRDAWRLPALDQVHRQIGLIDVRISRALERMEPTRAILDGADEADMMMPESESRTTGTTGKTVIDTRTLQLSHARQVLERQEAAVDRMLARRERLLDLKVRIEAAASGGGIRLVVDLL